MTKRFRFDFNRADIIDWRIPEQRGKLLRDLGAWSGNGGQRSAAQFGTADIRDVAKMEGQHHGKEYFDAFYDKVKGRLKSQSRPGGSEISDVQGGNMPMERRCPKQAVKMPWKWLLMVLMLLGGAVYVGVTWHSESQALKEAVEAEKKRIEQEAEAKRGESEQKRREEEERHEHEIQRKDAEQLTKLRTAIKVKVRDAKGGMERIADFRADPVGFKEHLDNADEKWKYVEVVEMNPASVAEAEAVFKLVEESEDVIANEMKWLKANKGARDEAKSIEAEIARDIHPELERVDAGKYAKETFLAGKRLRDDGNSALAQGDFPVAKERLLAAKKKLSEAIAEAKSPWSSDMWQQMKEDALSFRLEYEKRMRRNILVAYVPQRWLDFGDPQLALDLMRGTNVVEQIQDVTLSQDEVNPDYRRAEMKCPASRTKGIDAYVLHVMYKSWPVDLRYIPTVGVNIEEGKFEQKVTPFAMATVYFMGERRELLEPIPQFQGDVSLAISNNLNRVVRPDGRKFLCALELCGGTLLAVYRAKDCVNSNEVVMTLRLLPSVTEVRTNGLLHVQARSQNYYVAYTNEMPASCRIVMDARFLNPCGAQIFAVRDVKKLGAWEGGESILSMPRDLQGCELPSYVILKWCKN